MQKLKKLISPKNWWLLLLVVVEIVFLGARFIGDYGAGQFIDVTPNLIIPYAEECTNDERGARIQNFTGVFATTRWLDLQPGSYQVVINYVNNGGDGEATFVNEIMPTAQYDKITLPAGRTHVSFSLWMPHGCETAQMQFVSDCGEEQVMFITGMQIVPTHSYAYVRFLQLLLFFVLADYLLLLLTRRVALPLRSVRARYSAVAVCAVVALACLPLAMGYLTYGHDLSIHLARIEGLKSGLLVGQFPVRMNPALLDDRGYPFSLMYADLFFYPLAVLRILGFSLQNVYRLYVLAVTLATALITRFVLRRMFGSESIALTGMALYTLSFYRLTNVFVRAAVGEYTAMTFLPLVVYGLWRIYTQPRETKKSAPWCWMALALGFTGLLQSHLLTTEMAGLLAVVFCALMLRRTFTRPVFTALCKGAGAAVVWNLWFLVPLAQYMVQGACYIGDKYDASALQDTAAFLGQIFLMFGQAGGTSQSVAVGISDEMPLSVGTVLGFGLVLFLLALLDPRSRQTGRRMLSTGALASGFAVLCVFMASDIFPWYDLYLSDNPVAALLSGLLGKLQFAWRFLSPATVLLVVCTSCALALFKQLRPGAVPALALALVAFTLLPAGDLLYQACRNSVVVNYQSLAAVGGRSNQVGGAEYLPPDADGDVLGPVFSAEVTGQDYQKSGLTATFTAQTGEAPGTVVLPLYTYPGYTLSTTAQGAALGSQSGYLTVALPANWQGSVTVRFAGFWYWRAADVCSLLGIAATAVLYGRRKKTAKPLAKAAA